MSAAVKAFSTIHLIACREYTYYTESDRNWMTLSAQLMSRQGFLFIYAWAQARIDELGIDPLSISGGTSFSFEIS